ncbi:cytochrome c-type biogenesis protein [Bosea sp. (in: a-proteobacteria)]|uniref:cytochrome c-type biogenesis protein n=1 Tax=Bosea sp. (in: a-proteobacteria) TaxID=1871050 RepID=UPI002FCBCC22
MRLAPLLLCLGLAFAGPAIAVQPDEVLPDAALEQRARQLSGGLRCLVCQNQSIDDSDAPLARDLRILVRERLVAGDSDRAVVDFVVARYGDFVLLSPPVNARTVALWIGPFAILAFGMLFLWRRRGRAATPAAETPALSPDEQRRLDELTRAERD